MAKEYDNAQDSRLDAQDSRFDDQDRRIEENAKAISNLVKYMRELRNHFEPIYALAEKVPEKWTSLVIKLRMIMKLGIVAVIVFKFGGWYINKRKLHTMAERYADVARRLYYEENNPDVALPFVDKAIEIEEDNPDYIFFRAYIKGMSATRDLLNLDRPFNKQELDRAHQAYAEAVYLQNHDSKRPEPYFLQGQILAALKETARAKEAVQKAVEVDPNSDFAYIRLAQVQLDEKDVAGAEASLDKALELNPKSKWAWLWKGVVATDCKKDFEAARTFYNKALEIDPKFDMALYNRGWSYAKGKDKRYDLARADMMAALKVNPGYKQACFAIGMFYGYEDNYPVAKVWMDKAVAMDPGFLSAHLYRGIICGEMKQYAEAVKCFDEAILLDPNNPDLYVRRAKMFVALGRLDAALRDMNFAYELDPSAPRTLLYLGDVYLKSGNADKALETYDKAIAANAKYDEPYARKAELLAKMKKTDEALAAIDQAIKVTTYKPERFWVKKGNILDGLGKTGDAVECYRKARTLDPKRAEAWYGEARSLKKLGRLDEAKAAAGSYLGLVPTDTKFKAEFKDVIAK